MKRRKDVAFISMSGRRGVVRLSEGTGKHIDDIRMSSICEGDGGLYVLP